jgi:photosystem II stability/assembly factor-like uncharacterized protein
VYRTTDGGTAWEKVLYVNDGTGAIDLMMSPDDPATVYAAMWTARRTPWAMFSGSEDGGVFKTTDGGDTWTKLGGGLPEMIGRIGLAISPANPDRVYVLAEAEGDLRGLWRSEDRGGPSLVLHPRGRPSHRPRRRVHQQRELLPLRRRGTHPGQHPHPPRG